ncbi:MAG: 4-(cytidine 5'-diphospho)-2-C-methyl-D-erythritol kinase [Gammaproteobacteria bacterium]|jgi:4-diphosphocytidyl-2-C-methyl-D-erythritol kinase|nr:4-(cytidine 5'-diphospho)-2-C-methyl-D-erythritol kinase [Gammaproteobacteria bacterium]
MLETIPHTASGPWPAPAKLNLLLHVVGRRADGYHELQTLFQFLTLSDWLYFDVHQQAGVALAGQPAGVPASADLCVRAAALLLETTHRNAGVTIYNDKRLPVGGGLGGGSSDAATTLLVLNRLWSLGLSPDELARLGLSLGADVPVFIHGQAAWAEGIGEKLTPVTPPEAWYFVLVPPVSISTAVIFSDPGLTRDTPRTKIPDLLQGTGHNDCEAVVRRRYPQVAAAIDWLSAFAPARLTGTGGCVFAAFETQAAAQAVAAQLPADWSGFVARGVNRSPLLAALE